MRFSILYFLTPLVLSCLPVEGARGGFNEDGLVDLFFTTGGRYEICLGVGNGGFSCSYNDVGFLNDASDVEIGDVDGDGHLDVVVAHSVVGRINQWCAGDGTGVLVSCQDFPGDGRNNNSGAVSLGDVNRDHRLDAVFGNYRVCLGDGSGGFDCADIIGNVVTEGDVDLADLNGDGYLDAVFANSGAPEEICLWQKSVGGFACSAMDDHSRNSYHVATEDLDGDGFVDIVFANREPDVHQICFGSESGDFACENLGLEASRPGGVALGDVNGDGFRDAVFANINQRNQACLGDGQGAFNCLAISSEENFTTGVTLADVTGDGRLEMIFANQLAAANEACQWDRVSAFHCTVISGNIPGGQNVAATSNAEGDRFSINAGLNDAWYNPDTDGQGFLITVFAESQQVFLAWFTYDLERPPEDVTALLGEPGHRWLTAQGPYAGGTAELTVFVTKGGVFDSADPVATTDPLGDGAMTIEFANCSEGLVSYEITSLGLSGEIPIQRIAQDNVPLCETLGEQ